MFGPYGNYQNSSPYIPDYKKARELLIQKVPLPSFTHFIFFEAFGNHFESLFVLFRHKLTFNNQGMNIQGILTFCEQQIEQQHTTQLRAAELLSLLKAERENIKNPDLLNRNFTSAELMKDIDTNEVRYQLNYAIILLTDYPLTQSFSIAKPSEAYSKEFADKLNSIKDSVEIIVNKYQSISSL